MEDRDPVVALQACIASIRRNEVQDGSTVERLHQCLRRVGAALREKDREIEWLREALDQRDSEQRSREDHQQQWEGHQPFEQASGSDVQCGEVTSESSMTSNLQGAVNVSEGGANLRGVSVSLDQSTVDTSWRDLEPGHEPAYENMVVSEQNSQVSNGNECEMTNTPDCLMKEALHATDEGRFGGWRWQTDVVVV